MLQFNFLPFPNLHTERLTLRQMTLNDAENHFFLHTNEQVMLYMDAEKTESIEKSKEYVSKVNAAIAENQSIVWAISLKGESEMIGTIGFWKTMPFHHRAEIGYRLHPDFWQKGLMKEALRAILHHGFEEMNLHSVEANVSIDNKASKQLLLSQNFVLEAHFKENYYFDGKFLDSHIYSLLKKNFN